MTVLRFEGLVACDDGGNPSRPTIGERDVIEEISDAFGYGPHPVTIALADDRFSGDLDADEGNTGYSEWTPGYPSKLRVGAHDVLDRLRELDGKHATLWVADEPINTLERSQEESDG